MRKTSVFVLVILLTIPFFVSAEKIKIRFSPSVGEKLKYQLDSVIKSSGANLLGNDMSMNAASNGTIMLNIQRVTGNNVYTELMSDDLRATVQSPVDTRSIDLVTKEGKGLKIVFDRSGKVSEIGNMTALQRQNLMNFSMVQIIRNYFPVFPDKPVEVGDKWNDNMKMTVPFQGMQVIVLLNTTYTLDSVVNTQNGREASISCDYTVSLGGKRNYAQGEAVFTGNGSGTGFIHYLVGKGYFTEYRLNYEIAANVEIKNKTTTFMSIPIELTAEAMLQLIK